jgi:hypothetical protein
MHLRQRFSLLVVLSLATSISLASGFDEYSSVKPLLFQALDAPDGTIQGELSGAMADKIKSTTKSSSPVIATVITIKQFKQEGCSRLNLHLQQGNVPTKSGLFTDFVVDFGLNLCKDGSPPSEGINLEDVARSMGH